MSLLLPVKKMLRPEGLARLQGAGASSFAPYPAPPGFHWEFVYDFGSRVYDSGSPVIDLVGN